MSNNEKINEMNSFAVKFNLKFFFLAKNSIINMEEENAGERQIEWKLRNQQWCEKISHSRVASAGEN